MQKTSVQIKLEGLYVTKQFLNNLTVAQMISVVAVLLLQLILRMPGRLGPQRCAQQSRILVTYMNVNHKHKKNWI